MLERVVIHNNIEKYLPQKRKVRENNSWYTALVILAGLSLFFRQIFSHINDKMMKLSLYPEPFNPLPDDKF